MRNLVRSRARLGETRVMFSSISGMGTSTDMEFYDVLFVETSVSKIYI